MAQQKNNTLALDHAYKQYQQGGKTLQVLHNVSATFVQGHSYALTGVSGSGKSTLIHLLGGLDQPSSGKILFNNANIAHLSDSQKDTFLNRTIGFVFQFHYLIKELSARENIMMMGLVKGDDKQQCINRANDLLAMVGLADKAEHYPTRLSGGEQQRVSIARALFNKPAFLLADEPTGNLDGENAEQIVELFFRAQQEWGMGIILCSHDPAVFGRMQTIYRLHDGALLAQKS